MSKRFPQGLKMTKNTIALAFSGLFLTACGGSGSSGPEPTTNTPPVVNAGSNQSVDEQTTVTLNASASDNDGTIASISWQQTSGQSVELTDTSSETLTFTAPIVTENQTLTFSITATDNEGGSATDSVDITVLPVNALPVVTVTGQTTINEQTVVNLAADANDTDGEIISYQWSQSSGTQVELTNADSPQLSFTAPAVQSEQLLSFIVTVTDNEGAQITESIDITVLPVNALPVVTVTGQTTINEQTVVNLTADANDPDGEIVSYQWSQSSGTQVELTNADSPQLSFTAPAVQSEQLLSFIVTVTDNEGGQTNESVDVTVIPTNDSPIVTLSRDLWLQQQTLTTLTPEYSDSDGQVVSFKWTQTFGPALAVDNTISEVLTFTTPSVQSGIETFRFSLEVTDNQGATSSDEIEFVVHHSQMNTFNGAEFSAGESFTWEVSNTSSTSFTLESDVDIGVNQRGLSGTVVVPYIAEPTPLYLVENANGKTYLADTVNLLPNSQIKFTQQDNQAAPQDLSVEVKNTIYTDLDNDGFVDLIVYNEQDVSWYRGNENGFGEEKKIFGLQASDIRHIDLAKQTENSGYFALYVYSANGAIGHFSQSLNGADNIDFVTGGKNIGVEGSEQWNTKTGFIDDKYGADVAGSYILNDKLHLGWFEYYESDLIFHTIDSEVLGSQAGVVALADINNDERQDIVVLAQNSSVVTYTQNSSFNEVSFEKRIALNVEDPEITYKPLEALPIDINRDGLMDFVTLREFTHYSGAVTYRLNGLINQGDGTFAYGEDITHIEPQFAQQFTLADINGNSFKDIVIFNDFDNCSTCANFTITQAGHFAWFDNDGTTTFGEKKIVTYPQVHSMLNSSQGVSGSAMHVLDINGDGKSDLAHSYQSDGFKIKHFIKD